MRRLAQLFGLREERRLHSGAIIGIAVIAVLLFGAYGTQAAIDSIYRGRLLPGVRIGDRSLGGLTLEEASHKLRQTTDELQEQGMTFCYDDRCIVITAAYTAIGDPDLTYDLYAPKNSEALSNAYITGRRGSLITRFIEQWKLQRNTLATPLSWDIDKEQVREVLMTNFSEVEQPAKNTTLVIRPVGNTFYGII